MRICPPAVTVTRRQRIGPLAATQVPPVGLITSNVIVDAGTGVTQPTPENVTEFCDAVTLAVPAASLDAVCTVVPPAVTVQAVPLCA
jgi:hypothetical protein